MAYNKFMKQDGTVWLDLTADTIEPAKLFKGITAHDRTGNPIVGTYQIKLQQKTATTNGTVYPDKGYEGLSEVLVAVPSEPQGEFAITKNGYYDVTTYAAVDVNVDAEIPEGYIVPAGTITIKENGFYDIGTYARADVQIAGSAVVEEEWLEDGKTHIWVNITEGRKSPVLGVCPKGTVIVDWGDGTTPELLTGTSITSPQYTPAHEYAAAGEYVITLTISESMGITGDSGTSGSSGLLRCVSSTDVRNQAYANMIQKIELGDGVVNIGNNAFKNCRSLEKIKIPTSVTSLGTYAFDSCISLINVALPSSLTAISDYAFYNCYGLDTVQIPDEVTNIGAYAFNNCYNLSNILLPSALTEIKNYCFLNCCSLKTLTISGTTTKIGVSAFNGCYSITRVVFPNSLRTIGNSAFANCTGVGIYDFTDYTTIPSLANTGIFNKISTDCKILVPAELEEQWKSATNWSTYADRIVGV